MKKLLWGIGIISLSGCLSMANNYRTFIVDNLWAQARLSHGTATYHGVYIGNPTNPFSSEWHFYIRDGSGRVISSRDFTFENMSTIADRVDEKKSDYFARDWKKQDDLIVPAKLYTYDSYQFLFVHATLISFRASSGSEISKDGKEFYKFPFNQAILEEIFGPPDTTRDYYLN